VGLPQQDHLETESILPVVHLLEQLAQVVLPAARAVVVRRTAVPVQLVQVLTPEVAAAVQRIPAPTAAMADSREAVQEVAAAGQELVEVAATEKWC
jgi:hypothetical protein